MSVTTSPVTSNPVTTTRRLAALIAAIVLFDVMVVRAPFLAFLAVPFAIAAWRYRGDHATSTVVLFVWAALYVVVGVAFAVNNGLQAPAEPGQAREVINAGDFAFAYLGTPAAAWLAVGLAATALRRRSPFAHRAA